MDEKVCKRRPSEGKSVCFSEIQKVRFVRVASQKRSETVSEQLLLSPIYFTDCRLGKKVNHPPFIRCISCAANEFVLGMDPDMSVEWLVDRLTALAIAFNKVTHPRPFMKEIQTVFEI